MEQINITYNVYEFDEFSKEAQEKAINEEVCFWIDTAFSIPKEQWNSRFRSAVDELNKLHIPWFLGKILKVKCKDEIFAGCRDRKYLHDGSVFNGYLLKKKAGEVI